MALLFTEPTKRKDWVKAGDDCVSQAGMRGTVLRVITTSSLPVAVVRWDNGQTGRHSITTLRNAEG
jgi:hypothetical protein